MEHRIEHASGPLKLPVGTILDCLEDCVAVALGLGEEREDKRLGGGSDEFLANHRSTIHRGMMYVKGGFSRTFRRSIGSHQCGTPMRWMRRGPCRLEVGDTAGWKPARRRGQFPLVVWNGPDYARVEHAI